MWVRIIKKTGQHPCPLTSSPSTSGLTASSNCRGRRGSAWLTTKIWKEEKKQKKQNIRSPGISGVNFYHALKKDSMKRIAVDRQAVYAHWEQTWDAWNSCSMTTSSLTPSTQTWFSEQANDLALIREEPNSVWVFTYFPRISGESTPASVIWIYQAPRTVWAYWHRFVCFY